MGQYGRRVSTEGEEVLAPLDILCAASPIWREQFKLAGRDAMMPRSQESASTEELKASSPVALA